jgi:DNA mismatch endonuclease Vsr|tara:strand:- start:18 stop:479 length:462 start_codon:yes stop_codon:yes gene_type:complete
MPDVHDRATRSRNMAAIKGKNTKPEILIRKELFRRGFRFRIHDKKLPGKPDIVLPKYKAVIFVHGCFWHGHDCSLFKVPQTRTEFWMEKIRGNQERDARNQSDLRQLGWRVCTIWECALKGNLKISIEDAGDHMSKWLLASSMRLKLDEHRQK